MTTTPKVSVVMLTYGRPTLQSAVESVLRQSLTDLELIVVVDPWRRTTPHLPFAVEDGRVRLVRPDLRDCPRHLPSKLALLRNEGVSLARGRYVAYLDDDNWWSPLHLETLSELLDANGDYGFVHSWRIVVDRQGCPVPLQTFPWLTRFNNRDALFGMLEEYGVVKSGTPYFRSLVTSDGGDEVFVVDTSELCIRREVHERMPWPVRFTWDEMRDGVGEDRLLLRQMYRAGIRHSCSRQYTLHYRLGGYSNEDHERPMP